MNNVPNSGGKVSGSAPTTAHIALCCNGKMLPGLHATLASLIRHLGRREMVSLTLFVQDIKEADLVSIRDTIHNAGGVGALNIRQVNISDFKHLKAFHGDWMPYLRLCLPKLMPEADTILYLDSDLIVNTDACAIFDHKLNDSPLGAVNGETVEWNLDHRFFKTLGLMDDDRCFNSGILLLNAELWRKTGLVERCMEFGKAYSSSLKAPDQTILNGLFSRNFYALPAQLNIPVYACDKPLAIADGVYHFVGSPKPWDPFGRLFHGSWQVWNGVIGQTKFKWSHFLSQHIVSYCLRAWVLRRSYLKHLLMKCK